MTKNYYRKVDLTNSEELACTKFQKEILESYGRNISPYNDIKGFEIFSIGLSLAISNVFTSIGIDKVELYLQDLTKIILQIHEEVKKNSNYMVFNKGEKVREGKFN